MASLKRKFEGEVEIRATASDVLHEVFCSRPHHISQASTNFIQAVDLHEGDHGKIGSVSLWKYILDGKSCVAKTKLEEIDEEKKYAKYRVFEGDIMKEYKTLTGACHVIPKDGETCIAKWILEYEKLHPGIPEPTGIMDAWLGTLKDIDDHHHGVKK